MPVSVARMPVQVVRLVVLPRLRSDGGRLGLPRVGRWAAVVPMLMQWMPVSVIDLVVYPGAGRFRGAGRATVVPVCMLGMPVLVAGLIVFPRFRIVAPWSP